MKQTIHVTPDPAAPNPIAEPLRSLLRQAIAERATDVHLDPTADGKMVRFRVDGIVYEKTPIPHEHRDRILNQTKIAANFELSRSMAPQEGLILFKDDADLHDIRVTVAPIGEREAIHFRFLSMMRQMHSLKDLGFNRDDLNDVLQTLKAPSGLILVAGPTGSGKSTTLYALANVLDLKSLVTVSIEDPVEYRIPHIRQLQVDEGRELTMYEGLRVLLRMDPDVILLGEIRDQPSAITAARAGLAGRLVLATIHAPDPVTAVHALQYFSVPTYVIGGALRMVITQELVRQLCAACAQKVAVAPAYARIFERYKVPVPSCLYQPGGCDKCRGYGYTGRIGVFEVTTIDHGLAHDLSAGLSRSELHDRFGAAGNQSVVADALQKAAQGVTSMEDSLKICLMERPDEAPTEEADARK